MRSRLLVVAKDTELRARLARRLSRIGHGVELAENISHARRVISEKQFCLAILSLDGVGPEGFDFAEELRSVVGETLLIGTGNNFGATKHEDLIDPSDDDTLMARVNHAVHLQHDPDLPRQPPIQFAGYTLDLDGAALIERVLPEEWLPAWYQFRQYGFLILFLLVFTFHVGDRIFVPVVNHLENFVLR